MPTVQAIIRSAALRRKFRLSVGELQEYIDMHAKNALLFSRLGLAVHYPFFLSSQVYLRAVLPSVLGGKRRVGAEAQGKRSEGKTRPKCFDDVFR